MSQSAPQIGPSSEPFSAVAYAQLVRSLIIRPDAIDWLEWLPVATVAAANPERWIAAFRSLSTEDQYELLDLLRNPEAGPLADALLSLLATHASQISDEQIRQIILEEAVSAGQRQAQRMAFVRQRVATLSATVASMQARMTDDFDRGAEAMRLEQELAQLRSREYEQDERFSHVHAIEAEILRLETRRRILERYDFNEREGYAARLRAEFEGAHRTKQQLEQAIAQAMGTRDGLQNEIAELQVQNATAQQEKAQAEAARTELQNSTASARAEVARLQREGQQLVSEANALTAQCAQLERERRELEALCRRERSRLEELSAAARSAGQADLAERINEIYRALPCDKADEGFIQRPANAGNGNQRRMS
jgi:chromosome segregation ATPase